MIEQLSLFLLEKTILVVEDDFCCLLLLEELLLPLGCKVVTAQSGCEAMRLIENGMQFDIVLIDILLKDISGYDVAEFIQRTCPESIIIAQTALTVTRDINIEKMNNFQTIIQKPFTTHVLYQTLYQQLVGKM